jgi:CDP-glycerol glycerophosphotransferase (TagB/SpsB family)
MNKKSSSDRHAKGRLLRAASRWIARNIPRRKTLWLFSTGQGGFAGNPKYLFLWLQAKTEIRPVWLAKDKGTHKFLRARGLHSSQIGTLAGLWIALRAGVHVFDGSPHGVVHDLDAGSFRVNLWHGVGVKNVEGSIAVGPTATNYSITRQTAENGPDLIVTSSPMQSRRLAAAFGVPVSYCKEFGTPRLDIALSKDLQDAAIRLLDYTPVADAFNNFSEVGIYMPTFRDSGRDFLVEAFPQIEELNEILSARNALLYLKPHRKTSRTGLIIPSTCHNVRWWPDDLDVYPFLARLDLLITDYSSVLFDYLAVKSRGAVLYTFDWDVYRTQDRDLAFDIESWAIGPRVDSFGGLCELVRSGQALRELPAAGLGKLRREFWNGEISLASPKIVNYVKTLLDGARTIPIARGQVA